MNPEDLTTHALGEPLPPTDRAALEQALQTNPQARADFEATQAFTGLLQQHLATDQPEAALTAEQKQRLVAQASPPVCVTGVSPATGTTPTTSSASLQPAPNQGDRAGRPTALRWLHRAILPLSAAALIVVGMQQWQEENRAAPALPQSEAVWASQPGATRRYDDKGADAPSKVYGDTRPLADADAETAPDAKPAPLAEKSGSQIEEDTTRQLLAGKSDTAAREDMEAAEQKRAEYLAANDHTRGRMPNEVNSAGQDAASAAPADTSAKPNDASISDAAASPQPQSRSEMEKTGSGTIALQGANTYTGRTVITGGDVTTGDTVTARPSGPSAPVPAAATPTPPTPAKPAIVAGESTANADGGGIGGGYSSDGLPLMGDIPVVGLVFKSDDDAAPAIRDHTRARMLNEVGPAWDNTVAAAPASPAPYPPPEIPQQFGKRRTEAASESYTPIQENPLTAVVREPLSTFSIDVDTAAYANVRRFLNRSSLPPRDAVRIEELVNYFPYNLEGPAPDSPHPFAVHVEVADCPWQPQHRLARIGIQGKRVGLEERNSNFVFLIDVSGSMNQPDKLPLVKESLRLLVERLDEKDRVAIVTYAGSSGLVLTPTGGNEKQRILAAIDNLAPGGSTHGSAGIQLAYEQAIAGFIPEGVNRVLLCTDGDFNVGVSSPEELEKLITEKARSGVFLSVLGYGTGNLKDRTMETLADKGNGNYAYIDSLSEARKTLVEQMTGTLITIAKDVKIQVEFNPAQVAAYRLIGYENRLLAKEDFNDDTKDAGEIGAGHSVTALYEIVPAGVTPAAGPVDPLKYQSVPAAAAAAAAPPPGAPAPAEPASSELLTVKLRYKAPDGDTSQLIEVPVTDDEKTPLARASAEFKFTAAAAAYGLMLRQSSYRGTLTWEQIRQLALEGKGSDPHGYRAEFIQLIDKVRGLLPAQH